MIMKYLFIFYFMFILMRFLNSTSATAQFRFKRFQKILTKSKSSHLPLVGKKILKLNSVEICYEGVGCFDIPRHHNPLQKLPEHPKELDTEFYLYRRDINFTNPQILVYDDLNSLKNSTFNFNQPVKILIHGYSTKWNEVGALAGIQAYLDIYDCNAILVNWEKGARGPRYSTAAANTELVGRQLRFLLQEMIKLGLQPENIHLIGFSLGAHVAACASQELKDDGILIGRITGLDPASPLFKLNHFRNNRKKLDISDAKYVDVIHTDGSPIFTDGFGLLEPLGHVDYFPNGGREQPGCNDRKASVVVSHFDKNLDREVACSHIRAYHYFLETLVRKANKHSDQCDFISYSCPNGLEDFKLGRCFPEINNTQITGRFGEDSTGNGAMYLVTREHPPFCGKQMQVVVEINSRTKHTRGVLVMNVFFGNQTIEFEMDCELTDVSNKMRDIRGLFAVEYNNSFKEEITADLFYKPENNPKLMRHILFIDKISIRSMDGKRWKNCESLTMSQNKMISFKLNQDNC